MTPDFHYSRSNTIALDDFRMAVSNLFAAEVIDADGYIWLWVAEPLDRLEDRRGVRRDWDEGAFRDAVRSVVSEIFYGTQSEAPPDKTWTIQFDPGRDNAQDEPVERPATQS